jgi:hypothetical protein
MAFLLKVLGIDVPQSLKTILALWFVLQIAVPFTAPLKTCEFSDLFGTRNHHGGTSTPESTTTPLPANETGPNQHGCVSPLEVSVLRVSTTLAVIHRVALSGPLMAVLDLSPSPYVRQTVLRL